MRLLNTLLMILLLSIAPALAEEHEEGGEAEKPENRIGLIFEMAIIPESSSEGHSDGTDEKKGLFVPAIGVEYLRSIAPGGNSAYPPSSSWPTTSSLTGI